MVITHTFDAKKRLTSSSRKICHWKKHTQLEKHCKTRLRNSLKLKEHLFILIMNVITSQNTLFSTSFPAVSLSFWSIFTSPFCLYLFSWWGNKSIRSRNWTSTYAVNQSNQHILLYLVTNIYIYSFEDVEENGSFCSWRLFCKVLVHLFL